MHNDAVVQGLSEVPFMRDVKRWGVLTIGTGLGNARFTNRPTSKEWEARAAAERGPHHRPEGRRPRTAGGGPPLRNACFRSGFLL